jgi:hypothetical protein
MGASILVSKWTDVEKERFVLATHRAKQANPAWSWRRCFDEGNKELPPDCPIGAKVSGPTQIPWIKAGLEKLRASEGSDAKPLGRATASSVPPREPPKSKSKPKVFLNRDEQRLFAERLYEAREAHPDWRWRDLLPAANEALPPHRRMSEKLGSMKQLAWLQPLLDHIATEHALLDAQAAKVPEVETKPEEPHAAAAPPDLQTLIVNAIVSALKPVLVQIVQSHQLQDAIQEVVAPTPTQAQANDTRRKVVVVGMLPHLGQEIQVAYSKLFDLRFVKSETKHDQLRDMVKHADMAIVMTKFVSHSTAAVMRGHPGMIFCNGTTTALKQILHDRMHS